LTKYFVKFDCPKCHSDKAVLLAIDTMQVFSEITGAYKYPKGYGDLQYEIGYAYGEKQGPDYETLDRSHVECSECGYQPGYSSDDTSVVDWLEENGMLVPVKDNVSC
jgi:hypothetical protein